MTTDEKIEACVEELFRGNPQKGTTIRVSPGILREHLIRHFGGGEREGETEVWAWGNKNQSVASVLVGRKLFALSDLTEMDASSRLFEDDTLRHLFVREAPEGEVTQ